MAKASGKRRGTAKAPAKNAVIAPPPPPPPPPPELDLDIVGVLEGADKSSYSSTFAWDYLRHYQRILAPWRDQEFNLIEIGVAQGTSLNVWRTLFPRATIVGIDIDPKCRALERDGVVIEIGSQVDPAFLNAVCSKYPPSIVIDDGSHQAHHIVYSFKHLFPLLRPGGVYIVEDMAFHFGDFAFQWAGDKSVSVPDFFLDMARTRMSNSKTGGKAPAPPWADARYIAEHLDTISFFGGAVLITKVAPRDIEKALRYAAHYLESAEPAASHHIRLAQYILRHNGPLEDAEKSLRAALQIGGPSPLVSAPMVRLLTAQGRLEEARAAAAESVALSPKDDLAWEALGNLEQQLGRTAAAIAAMEQAVAISPQSRRFNDRLKRLRALHGAMAE